MSSVFDTSLPLVIVRAEIDGPSGTTDLRLALDTGASVTLINAAPLAMLGYDPAAAAERVEVTTGSSMAYAAFLPIRRIKALGQERVGFPVLCHTLPPSAKVDGLLGLDFLRGHVLTVDFREGRIHLT